MCKVEDVVEETVEVHNLGPRNVTCPFCHAKMWAVERLSKYRADTNRFGMCCCDGKVVLDHVFTEPAPEPLRSLVLADTTNQSNLQAAQFMSNVRPYNCAFQMASSGINIQMHGEGGVSMLRIQGAVYHRIGALLPNQPDAPRQFAQLYIIDSDLQQCEARVAAMQAGNDTVVDNRRTSRLTVQTMLPLQAMLLSCNRYVRMFRQAIQQYAGQPNLHDFALLIHPSCSHEVRQIANASGAHRGRYHAPSGAGEDEVGGFMPGPDAEREDVRGLTASGRHIVVRLRVRHAPNMFLPLQHPLPATDITELMFHLSLMYLCYTTICDYMHDMWQYE